LIQGGLIEIRERFGDERRTEISHAEARSDIEDLIADQQMVIAIHAHRYTSSRCRSTPTASSIAAVAAVQRMDMKDGDFIEHLFICSTARLPAVFHQSRQGLPLEGL